MASARGGALATPARNPKPRRAGEQPAPRRAAERVPRTQGRKRRRASHRGAIVWIVVSAALLGGVVFINLAELRLNLRLDRLTQQRATLISEDATLQSKLSSAVASARIQQLAQSRDGLVQADPSTIGYINLGR